METALNRREFLVTSCQVGIVAGIGALGIAACRSQLPPVTSQPNPPGPETLEPTRAPIATQPSSSIPVTPIQRDNAIRQENARRGTDAWMITDVPASIEGYASRASAAPGDQLSVHVNSATEFDIEWYRLGWYGGLGGRLVRVDRGLPARPGGSAQVDQATGRADAGWDVSVELEIPSDWPSGMYTAVVRPAVGKPGYIPFIVKRGSGSPAPVLFINAAITWQAYNTWGGANLYDASTADSPEISDGRRAVQVSFDRPYAVRDGAGYQLTWELQFVRWQEREARDVDYASDVDLELDPGVLAGRRLIVFAGHHEYWSRPMRMALEAEVASGTNVLFLSANEVYWQVRLEPSPLGPARRVTCYKAAALDPVRLTHPELTTCRWREHPVNDPEAPLIGQMYGHIVQRPADWVAINTNHWLYEGTRLRDGDHLVNLVGQEYDTFFPELANPNTLLLAQSPVEAVIGPDEPTLRYRSPDVHTATMYTADSGATVFAAGTFQWSWAIDEFGYRSYRGFATPYDERVVRMTRNLFDRLGDPAA
jgi:hypothetical protein